MLPIIYFSLIICCIKTSFALVYNIENAKVIEKNYEYFGYSVFLQASENLFVGAPKNDVLVWCNLSNDNCTDDNKPKPEEDQVDNNSFFGASIDGSVDKDGIVWVCAPKFTRSYPVKRNETIYVTNGACYNFDHIVNKRQIITSPSDQQLLNTSYYNAFSSLGFSLQFLPSLNDFLIGAPGFKSFAGCAMLLNSISEEIPVASRQLHKPKRRPKRYTTPLNGRIAEKHFGEHSNAGYAVAYAEFTPGIDSFILGAPTANELKGQVFITNKFGANIDLNGTTDTFGAYFGASLCVADVNGDSFDDLLVGAPTYGGLTWDEGAVFIYIHDRTSDELLKSEKPLMENNPGARFGTTMINLGKMNDNPYDTVVIASPYADNGKGKISFYVSSPQGLKFSYSLSDNQQETFGFSLSKPVDINNDMIQDFAVGAYKSKKVTILNGIGTFAINFSNFTSTPKLYRELSVEKLHIFFCISTTKTNFSPYRFKVKFDERIWDETFEFVMDRMVYCENITVTLKEFEDYAPLSVSIKATTPEKPCKNCPVLSHESIRLVHYDIPILLECGADQRCDSNITIEPRVHNVVVQDGLTKFPVVLLLQNHAEPAYICRVRLDTAQQVSIVNATNKCNQFECNLKMIKDAQFLYFNLQMLPVHNFKESLHFKVSINCDDYTTKKEFDIKLLYESKFEITGRENVANFNATDLKIVDYKFDLSNNGPSRKKNFNFNLLVPMKIDDVKIFDQLQIIHDDNNWVCNHTINRDKLIKAGWVVGFSKFSEIKCDYPTVSCELITCRIAEFRKVHLRVDVEVTPTIHLAQFVNGDFIVEAKLEYENGGKATSLIKYSYLKFEKPSSQKIALWVLIGIIVGLIILIVIAYILYKINFFKRKNKAGDETHELVKNKDEEADKSSEKDESEEKLTQKEE